MTVRGDAKAVFATVPRDAERPLAGSVRCRGARLRSIAALLVTSLASSCIGYGAWTPEEREQFAAVQEHVARQLQDGTTTLLTPGTVTLPEGRDLAAVDEFLHVYQEVPGTTRQQVFAANPRGTNQLPYRLTHTDATTTLQVSGAAPLTFDSVQALTIQPGTGLVLAATRRGLQTLASSHGMWQGELWRPDLAPQLSTDGTQFVFVYQGPMNDCSMIAPTKAFPDGKPLEYGCTIHWPAWPGRDGSHVRAIVEEKEIIQVRDGARVVSIVEKYVSPRFDVERDQLRVQVTTGGKVRMLIGDDLSPPIDAARGLVQSTDGRHYALISRDGDQEQCIVDGNVVLRHAKVLTVALAADGSTWACAVQEGTDGFVVTPRGRSGPFADVTGLVLAPDGSSLAVATRRGAGVAWQIDGKELGAFDDVRFLQLLPKQGGAVGAGHDAAGWWLVAGEQRDGPWERIDSCRVLDDGKHVIALAQRGREAHRRVLTLP